MSYSNTNIMSFPFFFLFVIVFHSQTCVWSLSKTTALFAFGDSTMDPGNNNALPTVFRSHHPPYGLNFQGSMPTGRFSNGNLLNDFLVSNLKIKKVLPAYLDPSLTEEDLLTGVSFASAGSGLDDLTANNFGTLAMGTQLDYFEKATHMINRTVGSKELKRIVKNAIFEIAAGSNDFLLNFYDLPLRRFTFSLPRYQDFLLKELELVILRLYKMGARKYLVFSLPPIGCLPLQVTFNSILQSKNQTRRVCNNQQNTDSQAYNSKLQTLVSDMQASLPGTKVIYADIYTPMFDMIKHPSKYGFENTQEGCCGTGILETGPLCNFLCQTCSDPSKFMFWDSMHPTQAVYQFLAEIFEQTVFPKDPNLTSIIN